MTLRKQSLLGDGISHAALPGVVIAFLLTGSKNTETLLIGAMISGFLLTLLIIGIVKKSRVKFDGVLALTMSVFFGLGITLLTYAQKTRDSSQAGLNKFIFGQASALLQRDIVIMSVCGSIIILTVIILWKELKVFSFDPNFAASLGFRPIKLNIIISILTVAGIVIGLQTAGAVLMSALLVTPAVAAKQWCSSLWKMCLLSAAFGAFSGIAGSIISSIFPKTPTGPAIVICVSVIACVSLLLSPKRSSRYS